MTTATATRSTRTEAAAIPTGPAWDWFIARHPQVDQARIASRWNAGTALYTAGHVSQPDRDGTRSVFASNYNSPDREPGDPIAYSVHIAITSPRTYACDCQDWQFRQGIGGFCKHIIAVWITLYACCAQKQAEAEAQAILVQLLKVNRQEFTALLLAVRDHDGKAARTAAARLAGWPQRQRNTGRKEEQHIQQRAA